MGREGAEPIQIAEVLEPVQYISIAKEKTFVIMRINVKLWKSLMHFALQIMSAEEKELVL